MLTCGTGGGCDGGWPYEAWYDWTTTGVVTGGLYNRTDEVSFQNVILFQFLQETHFTDISHIPLLESIC